MRDDAITLNREGHARTPESFTAQWLKRILKGSPNGINDAFSIARIIEDRHDKKRGSQHLAVKMCARALERRGVLLIRPPRDEHYTEWYKLLEQETR